jgi:hypothetical protein
VVALVHFITEVLIFKTMSIKGAATPMAIAGVLACSTSFLLYLQSCRQKRREKGAELSSN